MCKQVRRLPIIFLLTIAMVLVLPAAFAFAAETVATVNAQEEFETLADALTYADDLDEAATVQLVSDAALTAQLVLYKNDITLDLAGRTISASALIGINGASLTIIDSVGGGEISSTAKSALFLIAKGKLDLQGGTFVCTVKNEKVVSVYGSDDPTAENYSTVILGEDATMLGDYSHGIQITGSSSNTKFYGIVVDIHGTINMGITPDLAASQPGFSVTVNGNLKTTTGNIPKITIYETADMTGTVYLSGYSDVTILGGTIQGPSALSIKAGDIKIKGGTFIATGEFVDPPITQTGGMEFTGAAVSITSNDSISQTVNVTIDGGSFSSENGYAFYEGISVSEGGTPAAEGSNIPAGNITINEGSFTSAEGKVAVSADAYFAEHEESFINGGSFSSNPGDYADDSFLIYEDKDGNFGVRDVEAAGDLLTIKTTKNGSISVDNPNPEKGDTVIISVSPRSNYKLSRLSVSDADGKEVAYSRKSSRTYSFTHPGGEVSIFASFTEKTGAEDELPPEKEDPIFSDIKGHWAYDEIMAIYDLGIMNGIGNGQFGPELSTTRGMLVTMLWRMADSPKSDGHSFADVAAGEYYSQAVAWAASNGIANGYDDTHFGPNDTLTREQLVTMLYQYASAQKYDVSKTAAVDSFADGASVSAYAKTAMEWAYAMEILGGRPNGTLDPSGNATRAEIAAILYRFISSYDK